MIAALQNEHGDQAKEIWLFLEMLNNCAMQLLLTLSASKELKVREAAILTSPNNMGLKYFKEISN